jgi:hypothetical protein
MGATFSQGMKLTKNGALRTVSEKESEEMMPTL